jgi:hypothetical protein
VTGSRSSHAAGFGLLLLGAVSTLSGSMAADAPKPARVEVRSADLLAVGVVSGEKMVVRVSHLADNSPLHDAVVAVMLRGVSHPTTAEADGGYTFSDKELALPGAAAVEMHITEGANVEVLKGTLSVEGTGKSATDDQGNARQMWWWALNFGVCIGFLWLISNRKKKAAET